MSQSLREISNLTWHALFLGMIFREISTFDQLSVAVGVQGDYPIENSSVLTSVVLLSGQFYQFTLKRTIKKSGREENKGRIFGKQNAHVESNMRGIFETQCFQPEQRKGLNNVCLYHEMNICLSNVLLSSQIMTSFK